MSIRLPTSVVTRARARPASRTLALALGELSAAALLVGAIELALLYSGDGGTPPWVVVLFPVVGWIYVSAGVMAWSRRPGNKLGALMVAAGFAWLVAGLANTSVPALIAVGLIVATLPLAMVVHLLHAFPSGRLRGRLSQATVVAGYLVCIVLQAPAYLFGSGSGPGAVLQISDRPDLDRIGFWIQTGIGVAVMAVTAVILGGRLRDTPRAQRLVVGPLFGYGILTVLFVVAAGSAKELFPWGTLELAALQLSLLALVPVAFAVAMARGGFRRTWEIEELSAWLSEADGRRSLRDALADALGDPSVELLFWAANIESYVDAAGTRLELPATGSDRAAMEVLSADGRVGAIVYDAKLLADPGVVRAAARVIALALDRERLTAELRASREGLRQSRARVVEAADSERRRIARDLHDGLQTRLIVLAIAAERIRTDAPNDSAAAAEELQTGLQAAIGELRELVTGVVPAALTQGGLYAAAEDLADRAPIPIELRLEPAQTRLPAAVESTGYFVLSEALTNAFKHADARELRVYLGQKNGHLRIEVHDDGVGGAEIANGAGLRSMADRVEAHEGSLLIESLPMGGTRITVEVPCAS